MKRNDWSPPYFGITNYHYDQWLRLWLLGGAPNPLQTGSGAYEGQFEHPIVYAALLAEVFSAATKVLKRDAVVYVRTDRRKATYQVTVTSQSTSLSPSRYPQER